MFKGVQYIGLPDSGGVILFQMVAVENLKEVQVYVWKVSEVWWLVS